jgi:hypothetical protein
VKKSLRVVAADTSIWRLRNSSEIPSFALYPTSLKNDQASA